MTLELTPDEAKLVRLALIVRAEQYRTSAKDSGHQEHAKTLLKVIDRFPVWLG